MAEGSLSGFFADLARLYPDLDTAFLRSIGAEFDQIAVAGGSTLVRRGDPSDALYIVISGRLVATQQSEVGDIVRLGEIGRGEMIGEMSILSGGLRTATVTALRDSRLVRISNQTFLEFMQRHPSVTRQFIHILTSRLTNRAPIRQEKLSTLALVPGRGLRGSDAFAAFLRDLAATLGTMVDVAVIDRARIEAMFPDALDRSDADHGIAKWLDDEEQRHDLLVYVCDGEPTAWTHRCLRQADRVLVIALAEAVSAEPEGIERFLDDQGDGNAVGGGQVRGRELVLLHRTERTAPQDTARWLALRRVRRHHHLREGDAAAMARLCRHLLGRSVGLALGGGGAKAFAEVGVLRALAAAGVPVDVIGGTSMGAVIGALAALGQDAREIHATLHNMLSFKPFSGLTLPLVSLLSGKRLDLAMHALFGETAIEDLWLRYFCISCNLTQGTVKTAESGKLRRWVAASNAVPGIMPPLVDGGELFVDGGLMNNMPADIMSSLNAGPVIAVNVSNVATLRAGVPDDTDLSGWSMLINGLTGRSRDAGGTTGAASPRLGRLLVRAMLLGSSNHAATMRSYASLYLTPPIDGIDVGDWQALDSLVETGYAYASKALESWKHEATTG